MKKIAHRNVAENPYHDFRNFLCVVMRDVLLMGEPHPLQYDMADYLQNLPVGPDGISRAQLQALRGAGKSVVLCVFVTWLWFINSTIRVGVVCSVQPKANEFCSLVKQILDKAPFLQHLRPDADGTVTMRNGKKIKDLKKDKNTETAFDIRDCGPGKDPSLGAYAVFGAWTGSHPDILIIDDAEIPENSRTAMRRKRLYDKLRESESLIMEGGAIIYTGTPQTEESIYDQLDKDGYPVRKWPAELVEPKSAAARNVSPYLLALVSSGKGKPGDPSYPERFGKERLQEKKARGLAYYTLQMLLDTSLSDAERFPLKLRNLIVCDTSFDSAPRCLYWGTTEPIEYLDSPGIGDDKFYRPVGADREFDSFTKKIMYIDPKGSGSDTVSYVVTGYCNGLIYLLDAGGIAAGMDGSSDAVMIKLSKVAAMVGVKHVLVESNFGGGKGAASPWMKLLAPHMAKWNGPTTIEGRYVSGQKEVRILDILEPVVGNHRLVISETVAKCEELWHQFTHISRDRGSLIHDDYIDALAGAVGEFISLCDLDPEERGEAARERQLTATAKQYLKDYYASKGSVKTGAQWVKENQRETARRRREAKRWRKC